MYAIYTYNATSTAAQVCSDITAILTGTTDVSLLSASCTRATSSVYAATAAGWELYDANGGGATQCVRAPLSDEPGTYKYVGITVAATTITISLWNGWNAATHAGVAPGATGGGYIIPGVTLGGALQIASTANGLIISSTVSSLPPIIVSEFTRDDAWRTTANGCLPVVAVSGSTVWSAPTVAYAASPLATTTHAATYPFTTKGISAPSTFATGAVAGCLLAIGPTYGAGNTVTLDAAAATVNGVMSVRASNGVSTGYYAIGGDMTSKFPLYVGTFTTSNNDSLMYGEIEYRTIGRYMAVRYS
jgi:hypothetical protein